MNTTTDQPNDLYPSRKLGSPTVLPRRDPVVYGDPEKPPQGITTEQVLDYGRDGFLILEGFFKGQEIASYLAALESLKTDPQIIGRPEAITEPGNQELRSLFHFHKICPELAPLANNPDLIRIARYLLDDEVYIHQSRINLKPAFRGKGFYWHSDFETWHVEDGLPRMRTLSMSISLTENTTYNGPLMLIPGSHNQYVSCVGETPEENYKQSLKNQDIGVPDDANLLEQYSGSRIETSAGPEGTVTIFDCNVMHGSNSNISPLPRTNAFFVFNALSNRPAAPYCGQKPRPEFIGARETIEPC
jgi:ectoine hydroxylase